MNVRCCDACKKILPENKMKNISHWWYRNRLELCEECYEKVEKLNKGFDERGEDEKSKIKCDYMEKIKELGVDYDEERSN